MVARFGENRKWRIKKMGKVKYTDGELKREKEDIENGNVISKKTPNESREVQRKDHREWEMKYNRRKKFKSEIRR